MRILENRRVNLLRDTTDRDPGLKINHHMLVVSRTLVTTYFGVVSCGSHDLSGGLRSFQRNVRSTLSLMPADRRHDVNLFHLLHQLA